MTLLTSILETTRERVGALRPRLEELRARARDAPAGAAWRDAFAGPHVAVIAEIKRRSPSAGDIAPHLNPAALAGAYEAGGARAVSVLTDGPHFGGSLDDLAAVRAAIGLPILRKDFVLEPVQVYESRVAGAAAVLLIARVLPGGVLADLTGLAHEVGLGCLVEVHDGDELGRAVAARPDAIGVNSRDLSTFTVDVGGTAPILQAVPGDTVAVAESGIRDRRDVDRLAAWGADAILVGTAVARAPDPCAFVRSLTGAARCGRRGRGPTGGTQ